ncbi:salivary glue protein Sgs-3 [Drosophila sechellia]|uniref:GM24473 n=1 Tax=Drosophila sechellia TaxID=7238 RepID=B4HII0_DROSE|nr:salivary glue protein Sgs-3 [Drosophila sechellia]EDW41610.1 GM24473 [Drosophila sechellia]
MSKITLLFAILCLCVAVQAQNREQEICRKENETCRRNERRLGVQNDVSNTFNNHCSRQPGIRNWRNVSRCELSLATCRLTLERCAVINCRNVRNSIDGGSGRPPTSRTTTPRIPDTRRPRTTRRTPTTRRGQTTRSSRRTTRGRGPTTRSSRRTTTRRPTEE